MKHLFLALILAIAIPITPVSAEIEIKDRQWEEFQRDFSNQHNLIVEIEEAEIKGLEVEHDSYTLFIPVEELVRRIDLTQEEPQILEELERFVGRKLIVRIIDMDEEKQSITLSEKEAYLDILKPADASDILGDEGKNAVVMHADPFGIFVRMGDGRTYSEKFIQISFFDKGSQNFSAGDIIRVSRNKANDKFSSEKIGQVPKQGSVVQGKVIGVSDTDILVEIAPGVVAKIPLDEAAPPGSEARKELNEAVQNGTQIPVRVDQIDPQGGTAQATPTNPSSLGGLVSGAASAQSGGEAGGSAEAGVGGGGSKREIRQISFKKRHEMYECVFELPKEEDCEKEDKFKEFAIKSWEEEYKDYRSFLEDIYYDNNCTWQDIVTMLYSEKDEEIKCEQRVTKDLEEVGIEQEKPARINRYVTCVEMIPESAPAVCYDYLRGSSYTRFLRLIESVKGTAKDVNEHGLHLTEILFEERLKRRELIAMQEEVYHRSDQLWQKLTQMNFNYFREMQEFKFKWIDEDNDGNKFIKCLERIQLVWNWVKERSTIL